MSKVKDQVLRQQEKHIQYMGKFLDYIYDNVVCGNLSESDLDEMERGSSHSNLANGSLSKKSFKVANNTSYMSRGSSRINHYVKEEL